MLRFGEFRLFHRLPAPLPVSVSFKIIHNFQYVMNNFRNFPGARARRQGAAQIRRPIIS